MMKYNLKRLALNLLKNINIWGIIYLKKQNTLYFQISISRIRNKKEVSVII